MNLTRVAVACLALVAATMLACNRSSTGADTPQTLVVFGAASLTETLEAIAADFEAAHPGVKITTSFAGSQSLRTQIVNGARADVFASANEEHITSLHRDGLADPGRIFGTNRMVLAVPKGNPLAIESLSDLTKAKRIVLAGPEVPAGAYADRILDRAAQSFGDTFVEQVRSQIVSRENHVRATLQKVVLGEADAALVYTTDASHVRGKVETIAIPNELNVIARLPIARIKTSAHPELAKRFIEWIESPQGAARLREHGFGPGSTVVSAKEE